MGGWTITTTTKKIEKKFVQGQSAKINIRAKAEKNSYTSMGGKKKIMQG